MDCLFCKIVNGEIPSTKVYEDDICYAFRDIDPQGPTHVLVIPKQHIQSVNQIDDANKDIIAHIFTVIPKIASSEGIAEDGYRVVSNIGRRGQQTVPHLHFHIIGGRDMTWPPG